MTKVMYYYLPDKLYQFLSLQLKIVNIFRLLSLSLSHRVKSICSSLGVMSHYGGFWCQKKYINSINNYNE